MSDKHLTQIMIDCERLSGEYRQFALEYNAKLEKCWNRKDKALTRMGNGYIIRIGNEIYSINWSPLRTNAVGCPDEGLGGWDLVSLMTNECTESFWYQSDAIDYARKMIEEISIINAAKAMTIKACEVVPNATYEYMIGSIREALLEKGRLVNVTRQNLWVIAFGDNVYAIEYENFHDYPYVITSLTSDETRKAKNMPSAMEYMSNTYIKEWIK